MSTPSIADCEAAIRALTPQIKDLRNTIDHFENCEHRHKEAGEPNWQDHRIPEWRAELRQLEHAASAWRTHRDRLIMAGPPTE